MARIAFLLREGQRESQPFQQEHFEQVRRNVKFRNCGGIRQGRPCVAARVRAEVSLASGRTAWTFWSQRWRKSYTANRVAVSLDHVLLDSVVVCHRAKLPKLVATRTLAGPIALGPLATLPQRFLLSQLLHYVDCDFWCGDESHGGRQPATLSKHLAFRSAERRPNPPRRNGKENNSFVSGFKSSGGVVEEALLCPRSQCRDWGANCASNGSFWDLRFATAISTRIVGRNFDGMVFQR